jgi:ADP-heptose:LPS heptosyltransferase
LVDVKNVLFLRYDRIEGMIITTPVFRKLKRALQDAKITVLANKINTDVLQNNPYVDEDIVNNKNNVFGDCISLYIN